MIKYIISTILFSNLIVHAHCISPIKIDDVRMIEKYVKYCETKPIPMSQISGLKIYLEKKFHTILEPIECGYTKADLKEPMMLLRNLNGNKICTTDINGKKNCEFDDEKCKLQVLFRKNPNPNSDIKFVVDKILELKSHSNEVIYPSVNSKPTKETETRVHTKS